LKHIIKFLKNSFMKNKIKSVRKIRQSDIAVICQRVVENMENNPYFPTLPQEHGELKKELPEYQASLANAKGRDKVMVSIKNDQKVKVLSLLAIIADYVTVTCKGDRTMLLTSGFDVTDENGTGNIIPILAIEKLVVELGESGEATTRITKATAAIAFVHQYTTESPGANTVWTSEGTSHDFYKFEGLSSDKRYWFRVAAIGRNGQRIYSAVVSKVIQ
jgi:hypothetical protein